MSELQVIGYIVLMAAASFILECLLDKKSAPGPKAGIRKINRTIIPMDYDGDEEKWRLYLEDEISRMGIKLKSDGVNPEG